MPGKLQWMPSRLHAKIVVLLKPDLLSVATLSGYQSFRQLSFQFRAEAREKHTPKQGNMTISAIQLNKIQQITMDNKIGMLDIASAHFWFSQISDPTSM